MTMSNVSKKELNIGHNAKTALNVKSFSIFSVFLITIPIEYFYINNSEEILIVDNNEDQNNRK